MRLGRMTPALVLFVVVTLGLAAAHPASARPRKAKIGVVFDGPSELNSHALGLLKEELHQLLEGDYDVVLDDDTVRVGDWTAQGIEAAVDALYADRSVRVVVTIGAVASQVVAKRGRPARPTVAAAVVDHAAQDLPRRGEGSGVRDLVYIDHGWTIGEGLAAFREVVPYRKVALFIPGPLFALLRGGEERARATSARLGVEIVVAPVGDSVDEALAGLPSDIDAAYLAPLLHLPEGSTSELLARLTARRIPTFAHMGHAGVAQGALCGVGSMASYSRLARRVAMYVQQILDGEDAGVFPVLMQRESERLILNMRTARAIGFSPRWASLFEAELLNPEPEQHSRALTLGDAVRESVERNLDLFSRELELGASRYDYRLAWARWLPSLEADVTGAMIDEDRAGASMGSQAERTMSVGATLTQVVWSEPLLAGLAVEERLQRSREYQRDQLRLDIVRDTAVAYLSVLRAQTLLRVRSGDVKVSRANLKLAQVRVSAGSATRADELRWRSQLAQAQSAMVSAAAQLHQARSRLNQILHRPQDDRFAAADVTLDEAELFVSDPRLRAYMDSPARLHTFLRFVVQEAVEGSPELRALDEGLAAQERLVASKQHAFYSPTVALQANVSHTFYRGGAGSGSGGIELPPEMGGGTMELADTDDTTWQVGVSLTLPLLDGTRRFHEHDQAQADLIRQRSERDSVREKLELQARTAVQQLVSSFPNIHFSKKAAEAAQETLTLVTESYSRGAVSVVTLLDAQNTAVSAELAAADAVYAFLGDIMDLDRAMGRSEFLMTPAERREWLDRFAEFAAAQER